MATLDKAAGYLDYKHHLVGEALKLSAFARAEAGVHDIKGRIDPFVAAVTGVRLDW
jgi:hypothetical protein